MKRLSWEEMKAHWARHDSVYGTMDPVNDPLGLKNGCIPDAPSWLNRYHDRIQRMVYRKLLKPVLALAPGVRVCNIPYVALDIGCGTGRWSSVLADLGFKVIGIDLQPTVIDSNRKRYPKIRFENIAVQEFVPIERLELVSCVTVLQHNPFLEQEHIVRRLRSFLPAGRHVLVMENVTYQGDTVFSRSAQGWIRLFEGNRFSLQKIQRYDYSLCMDLFEMTVGLGRRFRRTREKMFLLCGLLDEWIEPMLIRLNLSFLFSRHCGFLFEANLKLSEGQ